MPRTRDCYKMKNYNKMKELTEEYCAKGIGAIETNERMREKFVDLAPSLGTIYNWRRDFLERKGECEERKEIKLLDEGQKLAKIPRKISSDKYCADCKRDLCNSQYYELHMLKFHDILLSDSKSVIEYLDELKPSRTQNLIFRCNACFGGALDYDTIEELQKHKLLEHGHQMRMPKWCSSAKSKVKLPSKIPLQNVKSSKLPPASLTTPPPPTAAVAIPKYTKEVIRRDKSLPASNLLRRSNRVPKPISRLNYLLLAEDFNEMSGINERGGDEKERKSSSKEFSRKVRRSVNFMEEIKEIGSTNEGLKLEGNIKEKPTLHVKQQKEEETKVNGEMNGIIGGLTPEEPEEEEFVTKRNPIELEVEQIQIRNEQIVKNLQDYLPIKELKANDKLTEQCTPPTRRVRMLSTDTLDAATTLLKLTFGSPLNSAEVFTEQNSSTIANNECSNDGYDQIVKTTTTITTSTSGTSISNKSSHSPPPPTISSVQQQQSPSNTLMKIESTTLTKSPSPPQPSLRLPLSQPPNQESTLSNQELSEMEKAEKKDAETRIQALKNIQWLFDQAMLQFQQYLAAMPSSTNTNAPINANKQHQQQEFAAVISNLVPSSSSMHHLVPSTSSSSSATTMMIPTATIQNGISGASSSSMATTNNNKS